MKNRVASIVCSLLLLIVIIPSCKQQKTDPLQVKLHAVDQSSSDLKMPLDNSRLVDAFKAFEKDRKDETRKMLYDELQNGVYLIPVRTGGLSTADNKDGKAAIKQAGQTKFLLTSDAAGNQYLNVFIDLKETAKYRDNGVNTLMMQAKDLWRFVLKQKDWHGIVVNLGDSKSLPLDNSTIKTLKQEK